MTEPAMLKPKAAVRRFDVFAEYNRQTALDQGSTPAQAKGYGLWVAKVVAARRYGKPPQPSSRHRRTEHSPERLRVGLVHGFEDAAVRKLTAYCLFLLLAGCTSEEATQTSFESAPQPETPVVAQESTPGTTAPAPDSNFAAADPVEKAKEIIKSGRLGKITMIRAAYNRNTPSGAWIYPIPPDASPQTVNWEMFLGSAPKRPFNLERFFRWRCFWDLAQPPRRGAAFGAILAAFDTGIGTGSVVLGAVIGRDGFPAAYGTAAVVAAFSIPAFVLLERRYLRDGGREKLPV